MFVSYLNQHNVIMDRVEEEKDLGVLFSPSLKLAIGDHIKIDDI